MHHTSCIFSCARLRTSHVSVAPWADIGASLGTERVGFSCANSWNLPMVHLIAEVWQNQASIISSLSVVAPVGGVVVGLAIGGSRSRILHGLSS